MLNILTWAAQLERVAVNVSRSAMPSSSDNSELANRLAMQAAALEADNMDPLGLGRIDTQVLGLVSGSALSLLHRPHAHTATVR